MSADEMERDILPKDVYWYAVRITEGDTGERYPVLIGKLYLKDLPFSI